MTDIHETIKAFRQARIEGEHLLSEGKITWQEFEETMLGFETVLRDMGVDL